MTNQGLGLIGLLILLIIAIIVLGFFGISLRAVFGQGTVRDNLSYAWGTVQNVWNRYLAAPAAYLWSIFYNLLWRSFVENVERIRGGKAPSLLENQPTIETPAPAPSE
jgi:hypothetical protein